MITRIAIWEAFSVQVAHYITAIICIRKAPRLIEYMVLATKNMIYKLTSCKSLNRRSTIGLPVLASIQFISPTNDVHPVVHGQREMEGRARQISIMHMFNLSPMNGRFVFHPSPSVFNSSWSTHFVRPPPNSSSPIAATIWKVSNSVKGQRWKYSIPFRYP